MRVFVTGASGHVGSALVPELLAAGHEVVGLARSDESAAALAALGAEVRRGDLADVDGLRAAATDADGVVHLAFRHDLMQQGDGAGAASADLAAVGAIGDALAGTGKPFVGTSGTLLLVATAQGRGGTEKDTLPGGYRIDAENLVIGLADRGVRSSVVRLPPTVHSDLDHHGFVPGLVALARRTGTSGYVGEGANRWPAVHTRDAAHLYRLALENAPAGTRLHAVADEGVPFREIAEAIGRGVGVPATSVAPEAAAEHFGYLAFAVQPDNPTSAAATRELMGWAPAHPGLIDDLAAGHYFTA
ncbi:SDR family oxidoreductase [Cellulomonas alba]|uniref:SDR family oxidoreductase n=1 Tax=Cellulomonas alba TaxID=3053467 RepID=A0ABT7SGA7_9CELL|nr:SDR family oxidoreductase [Cellulomonas alba]MDM7855216.1 SDR family oxidoreductase [Cellulomonas alba]